MNRLMFLINVYVLTLLGKILYNLQIYILENSIALNKIDEKFNVYLFVSFLLVVLNVV
jgi:hypothetical protein